MSDGSPARITRDKALTIAAVCSAVQSGDRPHAINLLKLEYPFEPNQIVQRKYGPMESTRVFVRDGFQDRYTGERLIFPPVLRLLSAELPEAFPFHPNWKTDVTHPAYWELGATVDHLVPVSKGGRDDESNWVTTSMARNSAKGNWTLKELGWTIHPPGNFHEWDGLLSWFLEHTQENPRLLASPSMRHWHRAARAVTDA